MEFVFENVVFGGGVGFQECTTDRSNENVKMSTEFWFGWCGRMGKGKRERNAVRERMCLGCNSV